MTPFANIQHALAGLYLNNLTDEDAARVIAEACRPEDLAQFIVDTFNRGWVTRGNMGIGEDGEVDGRPPVVPPHMSQAQAGSAVIDAIRSKVADEHFASFDFGSNAIVVDSNGWERAGDDYTKIVFLRYGDDAPDADSHRVSLHLTFSQHDITVDEAYMQIASGRTELSSSDSMPAPN